MIYRLDYFIYGTWTTWGFYEDADEAQADAFEHQRVYGSEDVRIVPIPKEPLLTKGADDGQSENQIRCRQAQIILSSN